MSTFDYYAKFGTYFQSKLKTAVDTPRLKPRDPEPEAGGEGAGGQAIRQLQAAG